MPHPYAVCISASLSTVTALLAFRAYRETSLDKIRKAAEDFLRRNGQQLFRLIDLFELTRSYIVAGEVFLGGYTPIESRIEAILEWDSELKRKAVQSLSAYKLDWDAISQGEFTSALSKLVRVAFDPDKAGLAAISASPFDMDIAQTLLKVSHEISERNYTLNGGDPEPIE